MFDETWHSSLSPCLSKYKSSSVSKNSFICCSPKRCFFRKTAFSSGGFDLFWSLWWPRKVDVASEGIYLYFSVLFHCILLFYLIMNISFSGPYIRVGRLGKFASLGVLLSKNLTCVLLNMLFCPLSGVRNGDLSPLLVLYESILGVTNSGCAYLLELSGLKIYLGLPILRGLNCLLFNTAAGLLIISFRL